MRSTLADPLREVAELAAFEAGTRCLLEGRVAEAAVHLRRAVGAAPGDRDARFNLAVTLRAHGALLEALTDARAAVALEPSFPRAQALVGTLLHLANDLDGAKQCYARAVALAPGYRVARYYLGCALRAGGRRDEARAPPPASPSSLPAARPPLTEHAPRLRTSKRILERCLERPEALQARELAIT